VSAICRALNIPANCSRLSPSRPRLADGRLQVLELPGDELLLLVVLPQPWTLSCANWFTSSLATAWARAGSVSVTVISNRRVSGTWRVL